MSDLSNARDGAMASANVLENVLGMIAGAMQETSVASGHLMSALDTSSSGDVMETMGSLDRLSQDTLPAIQTEILRLQQDIRDLAGRL